MPQLQNLVLLDRATPTAVSHTFIPRDVTGNVGTVVESTGTPIGDNRVNVSLTRTPTGRYKGQVKLTLPVVQNQTINGVVSPIVVRTAYADLNFTFDQASTEAERANCVGMAAESLAASKVLVNDTLVKLQGVY